MKRLKNTKQLVFDFMEGADIHKDYIFDYSASWPNYEPPDVVWGNHYPYHSWQYNYATTASTESENMAINYTANYLGRILYSSVLPTSTIIGSIT